ncbi:MAG TPA: hypothetical protein VFR10_12295 [bacterium]|nr:hypothetical protein [bacterium]
MALRFEAGDHLFRIHAGLDQLERNMPSDGSQLLGEVHNSKTAFAEDLKKAIRTNRAMLRFGSGRGEKVMRRGIRSDEPLKLCT